MKDSGLYLLCVLCLALEYTVEVELNENGCPEDDTFEVLYAHEECNQYYECLGGSLVTRFCIPGLMFDPIQEKCVYAVDTKCHKIVKKTINGKKIPPKLKYLDNSNPSHVNSICSVDDFNGAYVAHENCDEFYKCSFRKPIPLKCAENLLYNTDREKCEEASKVDCGERLLPSWWEDG